MNFILYDSQLENTDYVKRYLDYKLAFRNSRKHATFYINICRIYEHYPQLVSEIIQNIHRLGYYKDYFHILFFSKEPKLDNEIYSLVFDQLKKDITNMNLLWPISTLGKWLPRETSKINKKTHFVSSFSELLYPDIKDANLRKKKYRQLKTRINIYLGTLERNICCGDYCKIDLNSVNNTSVLRSIDTLRKGMSDQKIDKYLVNYLSKLTLEKFIKTVNKLCPNKYPHNVVNLAWNENKFKRETKIIEDNFPLNSPIKNYIFILDLSKDTFEKNYLLLFGIFLLLKKILPSSRFTINLTEYNFCENFADNINNFMENVGYLSVDNISSIVEKEDIVIISNNQFQNYRSINVDLINPNQNLVKKTRISRVTNRHVSYCHIYTIVILAILYIIISVCGWIVNL